MTRTRFHLHLKFLQFSGKANSSYNSNDAKKNPAVTKFALLLKRNFFVNFTVLKAVACWETSWVIYISTVFQAVYKNENSVLWIKTL